MSQTIGWVVKGYTYGFKTRAPKETDTNYPLEYIFIDKHSDIAYILTAIEDGHAIWVERTPDYAINVNTDNPVYFIGETYLGDKSVGIPIAGPPGQQGPPGRDGKDVPYVSATPPPFPIDGMLWWDIDDPGVAI